MSAIAMARQVAGDAVEAVGEKVGAAAGSAAATATVAAIGAKFGGIGAFASAAVAPIVADSVQGGAASITARAADAVRGHVENPLDTTFNEPRK